MWSTNHITFEQTQRQIKILVDQLTNWPWTYLISEIMNMVRCSSIRKSVLLFKYALTESMTYWRIKNLADCLINYWRKCLTITEAMNKSNHFKPPNKRMGEKQTDSMTDWPIDHLTHKRKYKLTNRISDWTNWTTGNPIDSLIDCLTSAETDK